jgi:prepilin-type N-terminal cleavage/methylation domain-containing protein
MSRWTPPDAIDVRRWRSRVARQARCQSGFTLIELVVAMALSLLVGSAAMTFMVVVFNQQNDVSSRTVATNQAEQGLEQLVLDLRQSMGSVSISTNSGNNTTSIAFQIPTQSNDTTSEPVTWTCPSTSEPATYFAGTCTRVLTLTGGSTITRTEILGVQSIAFSPVSSVNTSVPLPVTSSTTVASVGITLTVQITSYGLSTHGNAAAILPGAGNGAGTPSTAPIVLQATADLRNFS